MAFILNEFEKIYIGEKKQLICDWKTYCNHLNQKINFHQDDKLVEGLFIDIDNKGHAIIEINEQEIKMSSGVLEIL